MQFQLRFEAVHNLFLLLILPLIVFLHFYFLRHIQRRGLKFANFKALKRITGKRLITRNYTSLLLRLLVVTLLVAATAAPVLWFEGESNTSDYIIAIDASASMLAQDVTPSRIEAAKEEARRLVEAIQGEAHIGIVSFGAYTFVQTPPTTDREAVLSAVDSVAVLETSGTDIPGTLITSTNMLLATPDNEGRAIVLLTDGTNTAELFRDEPLRDAVAYVQDHHTPVHVIGIGTNAGPVGFLPEYYNVSARYDGATLERIANLTGGVYAHAADADALAVAVGDITTQTAQQQLRKELDTYALFLALALVLLEWGLASTRYRAIP